MLGSMSEDGYEWLLKLYTQRISTCTVSFRLHCHFTSALFILSSLAVSTRELVGNPIECLPVENVPKSFTDTYCWIHPTYTIPESFRGEIGVDVPHPGVANSAGVPQTSRKHYAYYQWICFVLVIASIACYAPYGLWTCWEGGKMKSIAVGARASIGNYDESKSRKKVMTLFLKDCFRGNRAYAIKYFICEILCLVTVLLVFFVLNSLFGGDFLTYGSDVVWHALRNDTEGSDFVNPMTFIFPRVTKCLFYTFGSSGDVQKYDVLCVLPLNAFNEKIFLFLWYWLITLVVFFSFSVIFFSLFFTSQTFAAHTLAAQFHRAPNGKLQLFIQKYNFGDWFFLYMLSRNAESVLLKQILSDLVCPEADCDVEVETELM